MFFDDRKEQQRTVVQLCHVTGRGGGAIHRKPELVIRRISGYDEARQVWRKEDPLMLRLNLDFAVSKDLYAQMREWIVSNLKPFNGGAHYYRPTGWVNPSIP